MSEGWHERVAAQAGTKVKDVEAILARRRINSRAGARAARELRITSIAFKGEKSGIATGRIDFSWSGLGNGVWAVASDHTNLVGKSTVLEVVIWALRGEPKGLQDDIQKWLEHVRVEFTLEDQPHAVDFVVSRKAPIGTLSRERPDGSVEEIDRFGTSQGFAAAMSHFMMEALDLDPIPYQHGKDEAAQVAHHGWKALSSGLYFWGDHAFLLGDDPWGGLPARILRGGADALGPMMNRRIEDRPGWQDFFGATIRMKHVERRTRRVSPRALQRSLHLRAMWSVRPITFDPQTMELLIDVCPECRRALTFSGTKGLQYCDHCTRVDERNFVHGLVDLRDFPQPRVSVEDREALDFAIGLLDPDPVRRMKAEKLGASSTPTCKRSTADSSWRSAWCSRGSSSPSNLGGRGAQGRQSRPGTYGQ